MNLKKSASLIFNKSLFTSKKILILLHIFTMILTTGCISLSASSKSYDCDIVIKDISLKIALIDVAYEMYNVNIGNTAYFNENLYKDISPKAHDHYLWLKSTYNSLDSSMKSTLDNMFSEYDDLDYINTTINLEDNSSIDEIIDTLINHISLDLSGESKEDISIFLDYFYTDHLDSYIKDTKDLYLKKSDDLNDKLKDNNVNINEFLKNTSNINTNSSEFIMYYTLSPIKTISFSSDNTFINTINSDTSLIDIVNLCIYDYSTEIFSSLKYNNDFIGVCNSLKDDLDLFSLYEDVYMEYYSFEEFCLVNLVSGFSKYLEFKYFGSTYENISYLYDLDFYNYLKNTNFYEDNLSLKDISIDFLKSYL